MHGTGVSAPKELVAGRQGGVLSAGGQGARSAMWSLVHPSATGGRASGARAPELSSPRMGALWCVSVTTHGLGLPDLRPAQSDVSFISPTTLAQPKTHGWTHSLNTYLGIMAQKEHCQVGQALEPRSSAGPGTESGPIGASLLPRPEIPSLPEKQD